jgi:hypothetical protein
MTKSTIAIAVACLALAAVPAVAGTSVKGNVVAGTAGADPGLANKSKFKIDGKGNYSVKVTGMTTSGGMPVPVPVTPPTTTDQQYWLVIKGGVPGVLAFEYNKPFNPTKTPGEATIKGTLSSLVALLPADSSIGIFGIEIHEPTLADDPLALPDPTTNTTDCTTIMTVPLIADPEIIQIWINGVSPWPANPCASGALVGMSGISTIPPAP